MKKQIITTVTLATLGLGTSASAEEKIEVLKPIEEPKDETIVKTEKVVVTEVDVKQSEVLVTNSQATVDAQKEIITKAETVKSTADVAVTAAQNEVANVEELAKEATPEKIEETKAEIAKTETALPEADKAITAAEGEVIKATTALDNQDKVVEAT